MTVRTKLKDLAPGTVFNAGPIDVRVLEHFADGRTLLIADTCIADRHFADQPFKIRSEKPDTNPNDWRFSSLNRELNTEFLATFDQSEGPIRSKDILTADWSLADGNGGEGYGTIQAKIALLTQTMYEKYVEQNLCRLNKWWWLITPTASYSSRVRRVASDGSLSTSSAYDGDNGVRPAFYADSDIVLSVEPDQVELSTSALLTEFTSKQLVEEILRRNKEVKTMPVNVKIKELEPGVVFNIGPAMVVILEHFADGRTLLTTTKPIGYRPFTVQPFTFRRTDPESNSNDFRISTLKEDLGTDFLAAVAAAGVIPVDRILEADWELTASDDVNRYGHVTCKIAMLPEALVRKYYDAGLLEPDGWEWTITPGGDGAYHVRAVNADGSLSYGEAVYGRGGVRPAFYVDSEIFLSVDGEDE